MAPLKLREFGVRQKHRKLLMMPAKNHKNTLGILACSERMKQTLVNGNFFKVPCLKLSARKRLASQVTEH